MTARELYDLPLSVRLAYLRRCTDRLEQLGGMLTALAYRGEYDRLRGVDVRSRMASLLHRIQAVERTL